MKRSCYVGDVSEAHLDQEVTLLGWVHRRRDHGGVIFIDLRDREGLAQVVCDPDRAETFATAEGLRNEYCIRVTGKVRRRPAGTGNDAIKSGQVEVLCHELEVLNPSVTPAFQLDDEHLSENVRLTHRVLDLRRPAMQKNLMLRHRVTMAVRRYLDDLGFIDVETPMLTRSTPEGARDYLVPSRVHDGQFFALPQSPQLFKQLLMVAGFDRYYQIVKCFRDEDLRADRQPEFTQIDCETSFLNEEEIRGIFEPMIRTVFKQVLDIDLPDPFPTMSFADAMHRYGSDKPDLRVKLEFTELTDVMKTVDFKVFSGPGGARHRGAGIPRRQRPLHPEPVHGERQARDGRRDRGRGLHHRHGDGPQRRRIRAACRGHGAAVVHGARRPCGRPFLPRVLDRGRQPRPRGLRHHRNPRHRRVRHGRSSHRRPEGRYG